MPRVVGAHTIAGNDHLAIRSDRVCRRAMSQLNASGENSEHAGGAVGAGLPREREDGERRGEEDKAEGDRGAPFHHRSIAVATLRPHTSLGGREVNTSIPHAPR